MATLVEWPLPPRPLRRLPFITHEKRGRLYYTEPVTNAIGELTSSRKLVREWVIPSSLRRGPSGGFQPTGIVRDPSGTLWVALQSDSQIAEFDPSNGSFRAYFDPRFSLGRPTQLLSDSQGGIWFVHNPFLGTGFGRLDPASRAIELWTPPLLLREPIRCWIDSNDDVWFVVADFGFKPGYVLGRLEPSSGRLDYWKLQGFVERGFIGVATDEKGENIWLLRSGGFPGTGPYCFRLRAADKTCFPFPHPQGRAFFQVVLDHGGDAWLTSGGHDLSRIPQGSDCGTVPGVRGTKVIRPSRHQAQTRRAQTRSVEFKSAPRTRALAPYRIGCYDHFSLGYGQDAIATDGLRIFFGDGDGMQIGVLTP